MLDLFTLLVFVLVLGAFFTARALGARQQREERIAQRLAALRLALLQSPAAAVLEGAESIAAPDERAGLPVRLQLWLARHPRVAAGVDGARADLARIGWLPGLGRRLLLTAAAALVPGALLGRMTPAPLLAGAATALACFAALLAMGYQGAMNRHLAALARHLPECIDAITRICRAGVPLHSAFAIAASHQSGPLVDELNQIDRWLKLGLPLRQVMQTSARRVPLAEYRFFAVILIISQESGGRLGDTLERLSATLRARAELRMKVMAKTSEARASSKIVALLVPGVLGYMYLNAPADFRFMFSDAAGLKVTAYALASVMLGLLVTHLMVRRVR
ncbi:MAG: type II secretion system F family protein [Candidatus Dactylopiibacterium sp.]|nr:type II secretion system F family protein [Candidatus Dactylopiibacterium sp.]